MLHYKHSIAVLLLLCFALHANALSKNVNQWITKLDRSLEQTPVYKAEHEAQIKDLKKLVTGRETLGTRFEVYHRIYQAYQFYNADSAYVYATKSYEVAQQMNNNQFMALAKCNLAFIFAMVGDNVQAFQEVADLDSNYMPQWLKIEYFKTMHRLWSERSYTFFKCKSRKNKYSQMSSQYIDSLVANVKPNTSDWYRYNVSQIEKTGDDDRVIAYVNKALAFEKDKHIRAGYYFTQAWAYHRKGDEENSIICFIKSAIMDNESATMEITSLYNVSQAIQHYDDAKASQYVRKALEFINSYNAPRRLINLSTILPLVEDTHLNMVKRQRNIYFVLLTCLALIIVALAAVYLYSRKINRKLKEAQQLNAQHMKKLNEANERLTEANKVKNKYIGRTLYDASEHIDTLEHIFNKVNKAVLMRNYSEIGKITSFEVLDVERKTMFRNFDNTFLALFPNFVEQYNTLFDEANRRYPHEQGTLTSEMRIFALIRMGIKESERIARYLGYSVHTVNTYKTRAKNRSCVSNDDFETLIMDFS